MLIDGDLVLRDFSVQVIEPDAPPMSFEHTNPCSGEHGFGWR